MALPITDCDELQSKMSDAVANEIGQVDELLKEVRQPNVRKLGYRPCKTIAPMATDGGENRLAFEPLDLEIIRVVPRIDLPVSETSDFCLRRWVIPRAERDKRNEAFARDKIMECLLNGGPGSSW